MYVVDAFFLKHQPTDFSLVITLGDFLYNHFLQGYLDSSFKVYPVKW